jgi:hypothetical protein
MGDADTMRDDVGVRLRPSGWGRYFEAAFLAVWLTMWTVGELFGLGLLAAMLASLVALAADLTVPFAERMPRSGAAAATFLLFVLLWVTMWTVGGVSALTQLLRSLMGEDRVRVANDQIAIERRIGPFGRTRLVPITAMRRLRLRGHDHALVADTATGTIILTKFGTPAERTALRDWLQSQLALPDEAHAKRLEGETPPADWEVETNGSDTRLAHPSRRNRRIRAIIMWSITSVVLLGWIASLRLGASSTDFLICFALSALLVTFSAWLTWGRTEWILRRGRLIKRRAFASWRRERTFDDGVLEVEHEVDSDGDSRFTLVVHTTSDKRTISTTLYDPADLFCLGEWIAARTGFPLTRSKL